MNIECQEESKHAVKNDYQRRPVKNNSKNLEFSRKEIKRDDAGRNNNNLGSDPVHPSMNA